MIGAVQIYSKTARGRGSFSAALPSSTRESRPPTLVIGFEKTLFFSIFLYFCLPYSTFSRRSLLNLYQCFSRAWQHQPSLITPAFISRLLGRLLGRNQYHGFLRLCRPPCGKSLKEVNQSGSSLRSLSVLWVSAVRSLNFSDTSPGLPAVRSSGPANSGLCNRLALASVFAREASCFTRFDHTSLEMNMLKRIAVRLFCLSLVALGPLTSLVRNHSDPDINTRGREEESDHSQIMHTMHYFTGIYGPRLTGSPNHKAAAEWAIKQMKEWGFVNAHLEPWDFGHPGWMNERLSAHILSPVKDQLACRALAWSPGTNGTITSKAVQLVPPEKPTQAEMDAYLSSVKDQVKGKIVLAGKHVFVKVVTQPAPRRMSDEALRTLYDRNNPAGPAQENRPRNREQEPPDPTRLTARQINEQIDQFL